jgi:hypothetical protein
VAPSPTKPGTPKLSDLARKVVAPDGIVSTGWPAIEATCRQRLGVTFDPWQVGAGRLLLAKRVDGNLAAMIGGCGMSLPRQVGKTYLIGGMTFALCMNIPGLLIIWSAHHARTHGETFMSMASFAERPKVKPYVEQVFKGSGDEEIRFRNGSRILFGARERGFGRGVPGVDMIVSDEAQIMSDKALDDQLATMNTSRFGLAVYIGTPPKPTDASESFTRMRTEAWKGTLRDAAWIEFGADPDADPTLHRTWAKANPSFPKRTPPESILRLQRKLTPESFLREGLGVWDDADAKGDRLTATAWAKVADESVDVRRIASPVLGIDVAPNHAAASIVAAGFDPDRAMPVLEVVDARGGASWLAPRTAELVRQYGATLALNSSGPVGSLIPELERLGLSWVDVRGADNVKACGRLVSMVNDRTLAHHGDPEFTAAVIGARARKNGDGFIWSRSDSSVDITPLVAATVALWAVATDRPSTPSVLFL